MDAAAPAPTPLPNALPSWYRPNAFDRRIIAAFTSAMTPYMHDRQKKLGHAIEVVRAPDSIKCALNTTSGGVPTFMTTFDGAVTLALLRIYFAVYFHPVSSSASVVWPKPDDFVKRVDAFRESEGELSVPEFTCGESEIEGETVTQELIRVFREICKLNETLETRAEVDALARNLARVDLRWTEAVFRMPNAELHALVLPLVERSRYYLYYLVAYNRFLHDMRLECDALSPGELDAVRVADENKENVGPGANDRGGFLTELRHVEWFMSKMMILDVEMGRQRHDPRSATPRAELMRRMNAAIDLRSDFITQSLEVVPLSMIAHLKTQAERVAARDAHVRAVHQLGVVSEHRTPARNEIEASKRNQLLENDIVALARVVRERREAVEQKTLYDTPVVRQDTKPDIMIGLSTTSSE